MYNIFYSNEIHQNQRGRGEKEKKLPFQTFSSPDVGPIFPDNILK
jgi:hypothetical protein